VRENRKGVSRLNRQEERKDCEQETSHAEPEAQSVPGGLEWSGFTRTIQAV